MVTNTEIKKVNSSSKYSITKGLILWPHQFLIISGPGKNAQQSKQVRYLHTDEAHLYPPGTLAALDARMGERWDRSALHVSTASDQSAMTGDDPDSAIAFEIDVKYHEGQQDEWHQMCPHCNRLFWPLWGTYSMDRYGMYVYNWKESQSETETLESIHMVCPHCAKEIKDEPLLRREMNLGGDYIAQNLNHDRQKLSYRWSRLVPDWIPWRNILSIYQRAIMFARNGDTMPMSEFVKKVLCMTWTGAVPDIGEAHISGDYKLGDLWTGCSVCHTERNGASSDAALGSDS
jgi:phage terminase large subunit GpA-like protein